MCHLKSLIFDCISFTEGLITSLFTEDTEAPASNRTFVTSVYPSHNEGNWNIKYIVWGHVLIVWLNWMRKC
jgi:hypothetical protein